MSIKIKVTTGQISSGGLGLDMAGADITNVKAIMSASGTWRIDENGLLVVKKIAADEIELKDKDTQEIYCVQIKSGILSSTQGGCEIITTSTPSQ